MIPAVTQQTLRTTIASPAAAADSTAAATAVTDYASATSGVSSFRQTVRMLLANGRKLDTQDPAAVQQTAAQLASELFFKPLLGEMRQFPLGRALTDGGQGGAVFGEQLDQRLADSVAAATPALTDRLMQYFQAYDSRHGAASHATPAVEESPA